MAWLKAGSEIGSQQKLDTAGVRCARIDIGALFNEVMRDGIMRMWTAKSNSNAHTPDWRGFDRADAGHDAAMAGRAEV